MVDVKGMLTCESCGGDRFQVVATGGPFVARCVGLTHEDPTTTKHCGATKALAVPEADDTRREDEPGDWFIADFDGECSRGGEMFGANTTIRADGDGGFECRGCVDEDQDQAEEWEIYVESTGMREGAA